MSSNSNSTTTKADSMPLFVQVRLSSVLPTSALKSASVDIPAFGGAKLITNVSMKNLTNILLTDQKWVLKSMDNAIKNKPPAGTVNDVTAILILIMNYRDAHNTVKDTILLKEREIKIGMSDKHYSDYKAGVEIYKKRFNILQDYCKQLGNPKLRLPFIEEYFQVYTRHV